MIKKLGRLFFPSRHTGSQPTPSSFEPVIYDEAGVVVEVLDPDTFRFTKATENGYSAITLDADRGVGEAFLQTENEAQTHQFEYEPGQKPEDVDHELLETGKSVLARHGVQIPKPVLQERVSQLLERAATSKTPRRLRPGDTLVSFYQDPKGRRYMDAFEVVKSQRCRSSLGQFTSVQTSNIASVRLSSSERPEKVDILPKGHFVMGEPSVVEDISSQRNRLMTRVSGDEYSELLELAGLEETPSPRQGVQTLREHRLREVSQDPAFRSLALEPNSERAYRTHRFLSDFSQPKGPFTQRDCDDLRYYFEVAQDDPIAFEMLRQHRSYEQRGLSSEEARLAVLTGQIVDAAQENIELNFAENGIEIDGYFLPQG